MAALACPLAFGQPAPAGTTWQKLPTPTVNPPAPSAVPPPQLPAASAPGSRVVVFTKPAGEVRPVQATGDKPTLPGQTPVPAQPPAADPAKPADPPKPGETKAVPPVADPFRLRSDEDLAAEIDASRNLPAKMRDYNDKVKEFEREMDLFKKGLRDDEPKNKPAKPIAVDLIPVPPGQPMTVVKAGYAPAQAVIEPRYVVHRRLYFEEKNAERYGWDLGLAQPVVSTGIFFKDVLFWPAHLTSNFYERYDVSAGKCPPGSPVAYYLYPPNIDLKGGLVQTGVVIGTAFLLP